MNVPTLHYTEGQRGRSAADTGSWPSDTEYLAVMGPTTTQRCRDRSTIERQARCYEGYVFGTFPTSTFYHTHVS